VIGKEVAEDLLRAVIHLLRVRATTRIRGLDRRRRVREDVPIVVGLR